MPIAALTRPAATALALPPLEPPLVRCDVPGIAGHAVRGRLGEARRHQLGHVGLADDHGARGAQAAHDLGVRGLDRRVPVAAVAGDLARDVDVVLDRDRDAEQRPLLSPAPAPVGLIGLDQRLLGEDDAERVQPRVQPRDPRQEQLRQLRAS